MALAFKASMFTFLCYILPLFFKYPQDRYPAVRINTYLVHCPFLWWPQQAFAEMEALLTPFYHEKWQHSAWACRTKQVKNTGVLSSSPTRPSLVQSHIVSLSTLAFLPATLVSVAPSFPPKPSFLVQWDARGRKQGQQSKGCAEIKSLTIQSLTVPCSATWVEATRADVLIWR